MDKPTSPPALPKKKTWKDGAPPTPLQVPMAVCPECGKRMATILLSDKNGRVDQNKMKMFCDKCEYGYECNLEYFSGINIRYEDPKVRG